MFGFVVVAWFGLEKLMDSKLKIRAGVRGHERLEEHDPLERLRRMAAAAPDAKGARGAGAGAGAAAAGGAADAAPASPADTDMPSLEAEVDAMNRKLGDTRNFDYVPVPRTDEDDE